MKEPTCERNWVDAARELPVAFAQVREDPLLDLWVARQLPTGSRMIMIASGGCTAAFLAGQSSISQIHLVDPNPAQLALTRLKLHLLENGEPGSRLGILGHAPMPLEDRKTQLSEIFHSLDLPTTALGELNQVAALSPDFAGRYERVFAQLQRQLQPIRKELDSVLNLENPEIQKSHLESSPHLTEKLNLALHQVMALPNLVHLFGEEATRNPVDTFANHFAGRIHHALTTLPAKTNPYLWQMLKGEYPNGFTAPWFNLTRVECMPGITWSQCTMNQYLPDAKGSADFVHLSNILDWLSPEKASETLKLAWEALRPGGWLLIRQLNSSLDIPGIGSMFHWLTDQAKSLHEQDRSFFYRAIHLGRKL